MEQNKENCIPEQAFLYIPTEEEKRTGEGKKMVRRIYEGNTKFTEFEYNQYKEFEQELQKKGLKLPDEQFLVLKIKEQRWMGNKFNSLKFLHANYWNFDKAIKTIQEYLEWRKVTLPISLTDEIRDFLNSGLVYIHGRDNRFRPIIVLNTYKMDPKEVNVEFMLKAITYFLDFIINNLLIPGQVESWVIIQDLNGMGLLSLPLGVNLSHNLQNKTLKEVMGFLQNNFRARLYKMYTVNSPSTIFWAWKLIKPLMEETTAAKITISKENTCEDMWTHINKSQVEQKFGGTSENCVKLWPPVSPSSEYFVEADRDKKILVTKEEYKKLCDEGVLAPTKNLS